MDIITLFFVLAYVAQIVWIIEKLIEAKHGDEKE